MRYDSNQTDVSVQHLVTLVSWYVLDDTYVIKNFYVKH
jgi:hypothetical protein